MSYTEGNNLVPPFEQGRCTGQALVVDVATQIPVTRSYAMSESKISPQLQFAKKIKVLSKEGLAELFEKLKAEEAPLGMLMAVSREYAKRK